MEKHVQPKTAEIPMKFVSHEVDEAVFEVTDGLIRLVDPEGKHDRQQAAPRPRNMWIDIEGG